MTAKAPRDMPAKHVQTRLHIADQAARLMAEHGIRDYGMAKRKAARQLDLPAGQGLPSNEEVDQALIERQALFEPGEQAELLASLRQEALAVMRVFSRFDPKLSGAVASGTASEHSLIELEIQVDSSKDFEQLLINQNIEFKISDRGGNMAYLIFAEPADVLVRLPSREMHPIRHAPQLSIKQLENLLVGDS